MSTNKFCRKGSTCPFLNSKTGCKYIHPTKDIPCKKTSKCPYGSKCKFKHNRLYTTRQYIPLDVMQIIFEYLDNASQLKCIKISKQYYTGLKIKIFDVYSFDIIITDRVIRQPKFSKLELVIGGEDNIYTKGIMTDDEFIKYLVEWFKLPDESLYEYGIYKDLYGPTKEFFMIE